MGKRAGDSDRRRSGKQNCWKRREKEGLKENKGRREEHAKENRADRESADRRLKRDKWWKHEVEVKMIQQVHTLQKHPLCVRACFLPTLSNLWAFCAQTTMIQTLQCHGLFKRDSRRKCPEKLDTVLISMQ